MLMVLRKGWKKGPVMCRERREREKCGFRYHNFIISVMLLNERGVRMREKGERMCLYGAEIGLRMCVYVT